MQPQSPQNMYVPSSGNNANSNPRAPQSGQIFRNPGTTPRGRHLSLTQVYPPLHQGVVVPAFTQFTPRQPTYQSPQQYPFAQQMTNFFPFAQYFPPIQQSHQSHQRTAVNVNPVGNAMSVQTGPNGTLAAQPGPTPTQVPLTSGSVITGAVASGTNTLLGVSSSTTGQLGVPSMGNIPPSSQLSARRRKYALDIINPITNKNILEDLNLPSASLNADAKLRTDVSAISQQYDTSVNAPTSNFLLPIDNQTNSPFNIDVLQQMPTVSQTPIVSAISDAPSVEIPLSMIQKQRTKKIPIVIPQKENITDDNPSITDISYPKLLPVPNELFNELDSGEPVIQNSPINIESDKIELQYEMGLSNQNQASNTETHQAQKQLVLLKTDERDSSETLIDIEPSSIHIGSVSESSSHTLAELLTTVKEVEQSLDAMPQLNVSNKVGKSVNLSEPIESTYTNDKIDTIVTSDTNHLSSLRNKTHTTSFLNLVKGDRLDSASNTNSLTAENTNTFLVENTNTLTDDNSDHSSSFQTMSNNLNRIDSGLENGNTITNNEELVKTIVSTEGVEIDALQNSEADQKDNTSQPNLHMLIDYDEGQWSPINPTGKKQYKRDQLMQLRNAKASRAQPELKNTSIMPQPNLMPLFVQRNSIKPHIHKAPSITSIGGNRGDSACGNYGSKQASLSGVQGRSSKGGIIHVNLSLNQDVKLNETDNAWRPKFIVKNANDVEKDPQLVTKREKEDLVRRVRGILNKLTPEKFDTLVEEIIKLKIDTSDKMEEVMVLVFEKAIDEPNFSVSYARLCHRLIVEVKARDKRMESGTKSNLAQFRNALLDKTEREFMQNVTQSSAKETKLQPIRDKIKNCIDSVETAELEAQLEEEERKIRRRSGGTVRFIGELFKISMLTGKIIHSCIISLLKPNSEDMLECMCKLLTTVGQKFEQTAINSKDPKHLYSLDIIIERMQAIANKTDKDGTKISSRVRFMLQDVIDLRKNKWQSTRNEAPKTMEQIEKEAKSEQLSSQYLNYSGSVPSSGNTLNMGSGKRDDRGGNRFNETRSSSNYGGSLSQRGDSGSLRRQQVSSGDGSSSGGHPNGNNDDIWHVQTGKGSRSQAVDTNKLEGLVLNHQNLDIGNKKMGGASQFQWATNNAQRQSTTPTATSSNSFATLSLLDSNRNHDRDRGVTRTKSGYSKGSTERDRYGDRGGNTSRSGSLQVSRESSSSRGSQGPRVGMGNSNSAMQKSASHSKYQQMPTPRGLGKSQVISTMPSSGSNTIYSCVELNKRIDDGCITPIESAPTAIFLEPSLSDQLLMKSVVFELMEISSNSKKINSSIDACMQQIIPNQRCGFLYYILSEYLHLSKVTETSRRNLAYIMVHLINQNFISAEHFKLAYEHFCELVADLIVDIPTIWLFVFEFTGPMVINRVITLEDLWIKILRDDKTSNFGPRFIKAYLTYCTRDIGPAFTKHMWQKSCLKFTDFMPESEVEDFLLTNRLEYVENESIQHSIEFKHTKEKLLEKVLEHIDFLLNNNPSADRIIDYINGNIALVDKQFVRNLTITLCKWAISYKDNSCKLEHDSFIKMCVPVLHRIIDSNEDNELECLYAMQGLVHDLEHPRGLLSELFCEIYDADVIPQDSFIKWRDSKDQSAGKGVAVKGLNPFFNNILSGETSEENN